MFQKPRSSRRRQLHPSLDCLEGRALLNGAMPHHVQQVRVSAHVLDAKLDRVRQSRFDGPDITVIDTTGGYKFTNFDGPNAGTAAGTGTNMNGIANSGTAVGVTIGNTGTLTNFTVDPLRSRTTKILNINGSTTAMAFGINSAGTVVGTDGNGNAFSLSRRGVLKTFIPTGGMSAAAFGINDRGTVVGQFVTSTATRGSSGLIMANPSSRSTPLRDRTRSTPRALTTRAWWSGSMSARTARTTASW